MEPGIMGTAGAANTTPVIEKFLLRTLNFFVHRIKLRLIKPAMKAILPATWLRQIRRHQSRRWDAKFQSQPAVEVFTAIYREAKWGAGPLGDFHSGSGSHDPKIVLPYLEAVRGFLQSLPTAPSLVDMGCGDFNIGRQMRHYCGKYTACDVVPALISRNQIEFSHLNVDFRCLDITHDDLPGADVAVLRQVLQHLSNAQILKIVPSWPGKRRTSRSYSCSPKSDGGPRQLQGPRAKV